MSLSLHIFFKSSKATSAITSNMTWSSELWLSNPALTLLIEVGFDIIFVRVKSSVRLNLYNELFLIIFYWLVGHDDFLNLILVFFPKLSLFLWGLSVILYLNTIISPINPCSLRVFCLNPLEFLWRLSTSRLLMSIECCESS